MEASYGSVRGHELPNWPILAVPHTTERDTTWKLSKYFPVVSAFALGKLSFGRKDSSVSIYP